MPDTKLTLDDIADLRAYERERQQFRASVIELKKRRRIAVGPIVTFVFENRDTIRFQIQEMARAERLMTDEAIETELRIYNPLIPDPGHLSATMFIELTTDAALREWLPKLVGIETAAYLVVGGERIRCTVDPDHEKQLTRDETTASVHYVGWELAPEQIERFASEPLALALDHAAYQHETELAEPTRHELLADLRGQ